MPTVIQINVCANYRSTGKIAEEIGQLAISRGWRSVIAYGDSVRTSKNELVHVGSKFELFEHAIETRLFDNHGLASCSATKKFLQTVNEIKPDIIHLHNIHGYFLNYPMLFEYLSKRDIPVIWTMHDCWPITGHCAYFDYTKCERWKTECHSPCPGKRQYPASLLFESPRRNYRIKKEVFQKVENLTLVPVSDWLGKLLTYSFLSKYPIEVIHNGIDLDVFSQVDSSGVRIKYGIGEGNYIIGVASVWDYRKGIDAFFELKKKLKEDVKIVLVGLNKNQLLQAESIGIIGVPRTDSANELAALYSGAALYCNLTYEDNYPTTNLEAMACGTPVLTFNTGGSVEAVTPDTGWIVEKGDIESIVSIIEHIKNDSIQENVAQRELCRHRAQKEFDKNVAFQRYLELYDRLIQ